MKHGTYTKLCNCLAFLESEMAGKNEIKLAKQVITEAITEYEAKVRRKKAIADVLYSKIPK